MLSLQATALGLHTYGMAGFDKDKARAAFSVPADFDLCAVWAIGYRAEPSALPEPYREFEKSSRTRKPLEEFVFREWEKQASFEVL